MYGKDEFFYDNSWRIPVMSYLKGCSWCDDDQMMFANSPRWAPFYNIIMIEVWMTDTYGFAVIYLWFINNYLAYVTEYKDLYGIIHPNYSLIWVYGYILSVQSKSFIKPDKKKSMSA